MCDIPDWPVVTHLWNLCNEYDLDVLEVGACCAFLMELWQRGILNQKDMVEFAGEPLSLEWGNCESVAKVIQSIASQSNQLGRMFRKGVYRGTAEMERLKETPLLQYALYGKGGAAFIEDVRNTPSWATNMEVASRGANHLKGFGTLDNVNRPDISQLYFGRPEGAEPMTTTLKGASSALAENRWAMLNSLGVCLFVVTADPVSFPPSLHSRALEAATGLALSPEELLKARERTVNLEKTFNSRLGLRREDDLICQRWLKEGMKDGVGQGWKAEDYLEQTKD